MKTKYLLIPAIVCLTASCTTKETGFTVKGNIRNANEKMLYLEALTLNGTTSLDSALLDETGFFSFTGPRTYNPEFYRLRIGHRFINFAIDSTEQITINAHADSIGYSYEITGSEESKIIREIGKKQTILEQKVRNILTNNNITYGEKQQKIQTLTEAYKDQIKQKFILNKPEAPSAYFALFQTLMGRLIFDPVHNAEDVRWFAAVATAWDNLYPNTPRSENLKNITLQGQANTRRPQNIQVEVSNKKIKTSGIIDISLRNLNGKRKSLSELTGKVVLLDFTAYSMPASQERILEMRRLYEQYHRQGFEIYQISYDASEHYWKTVSEALPWTCVYDPDGLRSDKLVLYNIQALPGSFLIDRNNDLICRISKNTDLKAEIEKLL